MTDVTIPHSAEALTADWFTAALQGAGVLDHGVVTDVAIEPVGLGVGLMGVLFRSTLTVEGEEGPGTVITKLPTPDAQSRHVAEIFRFYEKEVKFYRELAADAPVGSPVVHVAAWDEASGDFVLVMEDLGTAEVIDQVAGATADQASLLLGQLADLHANYWGGKVIDDTPWLPFFRDPPFPQGLMQSSSDASGPFLEKLGDHLPGELGDVIGPYIEGLPARMAALSEPPYTLCHGDYRLDNFFLGGPRDLTVIDWQICGKAHAGYDLGYFMSQSLAPEVRAAHEAGLLEEYRQRLAANGVEISADDLRTQYRRAIMQCFCYPLVAGGQIELVNDRAVALVTCMLDRSTSAILDLEATDFL